MRTRFWGPATLAASLLIPAAADAQLTDETQTNSTMPGGAIAKSLDEQIGTGHGDEFTSGSSVYLIKRDPARSIRRGRQLFQRKFTRDQGLGPRVNFDSTGDIADNAALGAGLSDSCTSCHGRPRGAAGFGGDVVTRPDSRDSPHLFGLGLQEMLADEITADLRRIRDEAIAAASSVTPSSFRRPSSRCRHGRKDCRPQVPDNGATRELRSKGISFGWISADADGNVDMSEVEGVDDDLRVKPFFAQGGTISMREFIVGALNAEMGLQAPDPVLCAATDPAGAVRMVSPAGMVFDPGLDAFERPPVCSTGSDGDGDGVVNEIDAALIDHMEFYLLNYFKPGTGPVPRREATAIRYLDKIGCTGCHVQNLVIEQDRRVADVETRFDPVQGIFNRLFATATPLFEVVPDGEPFPQLLPAGAPFEVRSIYTDFKRHDLGPDFHERQFDGTMVREFMTEPLWGVASTSPYGHDGRSVNLDEVILRHGGEALASRDAYARSRSGRRAILEYLASLILFPPDDTASNLNPGNPDGHPQDPANHGSINLGALFQIDSEGPE